VESPRFEVVPVDANAFMVVDGLSASEFCTCADYDGAIPAGQRARCIAEALNKAWVNDMIKIAGVVPSNL
jgi:hypothetical protein